MVGQLAVGDGAPGIGHRQGRVVRTAVVQHASQCDAGATVGVAHRRLILFREVTNRSARPRRCGPEPAPGQAPMWTMLSISTLAPPGSAATPTADREDRRSSPKISTNNSEAPSTTFGISVNSGVTRTKPVTLRNRLIRFRSPRAARRFANVTSMAPRAEARPSSIERSPPRAPTYASRPGVPGSMAMLPEVKANSPAITTGV